MNPKTPTLRAAARPGPPNPPAPAKGRSATLAELERVLLLHGLARERLQQLAPQVHVHALERGQWVLRKGQPGEQLLFLLNGQLLVVDETNSGQAVGLNFLGPGEVFGELSVIDGLPRTASVLATTPVQVGYLARAQALELLYQQPLVAERMLQRLAQSVRKATALRSILALPQAAQRVCALLLQLTRTVPGGLAVVEPLPRQREVAIMINTSRETVSRTLQWLQQAGVVQRDLRRLIVRQPQTLQQAASGTVAPSTKLAPALAPTGSVASAAPNPAGAHAGAGRAF